MKILKILTEKRNVGNIGEDAASEFLKKKRYRLLERNYVALGNEIDIIALKNRTLVFVEVKSRRLNHLSNKESRPAASVTPLKQQKIIQTAAYYKTHTKSDCRMRFDVIEVYLDETDGTIKIAEIKHLENTFNINTAFGR